MQVGNNFVLNPFSIIVQGYWIELFDPSDTLGFPVAQL